MMRLLTLAALMLTLCGACSYEDRIAAGYALQRAGDNLRSSHTVYCSTTTYGRHSTTSCY